MGPDSVSDTRDTVRVTRFTYRQMTVLCLWRQSVGASHSVRHRPLACGVSDGVGDRFWKTTELQV